MGTVENETVKKKRQEKQKRQENDTKHKTIQ